MIKLEVDKDRFRSEINGDMLTIAAELIKSVTIICDQIGEESKIESHEFKFIIQNALKDESVWDGSFVNRLNKTTVTLDMETINEMAEIGRILKENLGDVK